MIGMDPAAREALLVEVLRDLAPTATPPPLTLTWDQVRALRDRLPRLDLGAHTVEHTNLSACPREVAQREAALSAADMERELGKAPEHFAFPYARSSASGRDAVIAAGFRAAVANAGEPVVRSGCDLFGIPRIDPPDSMTMLRFVTSGAYPDLARRLFLGRA
jgi:peptidoglycan/xylan/chitin deacetylase (PgdA/CDA1 family)